MLQVRHTPDEQLERAKAEGWRYTGDMATEGEVLDVLFSLVACIKPEVVVETGTYAGHGTRAIASALIQSEKGHLWTVESNPELTEQYEKMELERTTFVSADSQEWSEDPGLGEIDFAFVDCCEDPAGRVVVFSNLLPHIKPGGYICCHDHEFYRYEDYRDKLYVLAGPPSLHLPALNGFTLWAR